MILSLRSLSTAAHYGTVEFHKGPSNPIFWFIASIINCAFPNEPSMLIGVYDQFNSSVVGQIQTYTKLPRIGHFMSIVSSLKAIRRSSWRLSMLAESGRWRARASRSSVDQRAVAVSAVSPEPKSLAGEK